MQQANPSQQQTQGAKTHQEFVGTIDTIFGEISLNILQKRLKAEARRVLPQEPVQKRFWREKVIIFSELNAVPPIMPQSHTLVISMIVANHEVMQVYIDNGVAVSVIFLYYFKKKRTWKGWLKTLLGDAIIQPGRSQAKRDDTHSGYRGAKNKTHHIHSRLLCDKGPLSIKRHPWKELTDF